jgi:hydrogenase nickel incorporation protein HypB
MLIDGFKLAIARHHDPFGKPHHHPHHTTENTVERRQSGRREIQVVRRVLDVNDRMAEQNRRRFAEHNVFVLNLMSSPGSGKTTTLERTLSAIHPRIRCAVIVGDICTTADADRLAVSGAPVVQINTDEFGGDCHLAAHVIEGAAAGIDLHQTDLLIVENVGNLVCPAEFDIGEDARVVILSVTEGEDKPLKYPLMFRQCQLALLNKVDLLPHLDYDAQMAGDNIRQIHPGMPVLHLSAKTGEGFDPWLAWLESQVDDKAGPGEG